MVCLHIQPGRMLTALCSGHEHSTYVIRILGLKGFTVGVLTTVPAGCCAAPGTNKPSLLSTCLPASNLLQ